MIKLILTAAMISSLAVSSSNKEMIRDTDAASFAVTDSDASEKPLELVDFGWYVEELSDETAYVHFCGLIRNPNEERTAMFPRMIVTVKDGGGNISAVEEQVGSDVKPGDTITLCGMLSMPAADVTKDAEIIFDLDWREFKSSSPIHSGVRTTDFEIRNVSIKNMGINSVVTGEIINHYSEDIDLVNVSVVFRKEGEIVYMDNTFLYGLKVGRVKAFEIQQYGPWPEHDTIEVSAIEW